MATDRIAYNRAYYEKTRDRRLALAKEYRDTHKEQIRINQQEYDATHKEERKERDKENYNPQKAHEHYVTNKEKLDAQNKVWARTIAGKFSRLKTKAKNRKINFELTLDQYCQVIQNRCYYCDVDLFSITGGCIDRINNDKSIGYKIDNVLPCCPSCNLIRNRLHTVEETLVMVHALKAIRKFPFLIDVFKKKDIGFVKSPFIDENSWYPKGKAKRRIFSSLVRYNLFLGRQKIEKFKINLTFEEYEKLIIQPCFYCGISLKDSRGRGLDQIKPNNIYEIRNVLPCCFVCNTIKSNHFTVDETKVMVTARNLFRKKFKENQSCQS